jgi:hypothetical protein
MDEFYPSSFLVKEESVVLITEYEHIESRGFKVLSIVQFEFLAEDDVE